MQVRLFQNQTLDEMGAQAFLCRISVLLKPEAVSRLGIKWYAATDKGSLASMLCCIVTATNFDGYAEIYNKTRAVDPKRENHILRSFSRTSQHAARQHRENIGELVSLSPVCLPKQRSGAGLRQRIDVWS